MHSKQESINRVMSAPKEVGGPKGAANGEVVSPIADIEPHNVRWPSSITTLCVIPVKGVRLGCSFRNLDRSADERHVLIDE
jgi:hypothetical protein